MPRARRYLAPGAYYHVTTRGNNKAPIALDVEDRRVFFHILRRVERRYGWRMHARCLLGNHYHLVVETPAPNLSQGIRDLNGAYARSFNDRHGRENHVFGRRFWSKLIESEEQYEATLEYVVNNPAHHGFGRRLPEWRWHPTPATRPIDSPRVPRHRQADPSAVPRRLPDGRASPTDGARREVECGGLFGDVGRGVRAPLLLGSGGAPRARRAPAVATRRIHGRGALHAPLRELLPRQARARRRRARGAANRPLPARGEIRLRGTAPARAAEPRAGPARLRGAGQRHGGAGRGARPRLLAGDAGAPRQARGRHLETAHDQVRLLLDLAEPRGRANGQPIRAPVRQRQLVRDRPGSRATGPPHLPRVAHPRRHPLRDPTRARFPHPGGF